MRSFFAVIVAGLFLTGVPQSVARADCGNICRARRVAATQVVEAVVTPAVIAVFTPIVVAVPQYSVTVVPTAPAPYTGPQQPSAPASPGPTAAPAPAGQSPEVTALQAELARVRAQLEDCQKQLAAPKSVAPVQPPGTGVPAPAPTPVAPPAIPGPAQSQPPATPIPTASPATKASAAPAPHLALFAAKCAACHETKVSAE